MYRDLDVSMIHTLWGMKKRHLIQTYKYTQKGGGPLDSINMGKYRVEHFQDHIYIWSDEFPCVHILLDEHDKTAVLSELAYFRSCTIHGDMERGKGTKEMLDFAFELAKEKGMKAIELMDKSSVLCKETGEDIALGPFKFIQKGRTWYESMGFIPAYPKMYVDAYLEAKQRRKEILDVKFLEQQDCRFLTNKKVYDIMVKELQFGGFYNIVWRKELE